MLYFDLTNQHFNPLSHFSESKTNFSKREVFEPSKIVLKTTILPLNYPLF